jgi:exodeoxyribonuclease V beta subunit
MSQLLDPIAFPLHGSRLIEASAGTGKTWTIAALYVRLVLGHGGDAAFARPLAPPEILVMTFTRAATRELSDRVRERLVEAAAWFRGEVESSDAYLQQVGASYPTEAERKVAAHRLVLAAETMDEAAVFTIDAWCQRMLREHAFDSGSLFDEELVSDEHALFEDAAHDYWRQHIYPLNNAALATALQCWPDASYLKKGVRELAPRTALLGEHADEPLAAVIARAVRARDAALVQVKQGWAERADAMEAWLAAQREARPKCFNGNKLRPDSLAKWFAALRLWASDPALEEPALTDTAWHRLTVNGILDACAKDFSADVPEYFDCITELRDALDAISPVRHALVRHAAHCIAARMAELKQRKHQFGFADMLERLKQALLGPNGAQLRERIVAQFPVALIDEFQDTSPDQYQIFNLLYRVADNDRARGLFLIGDPKQSIYGFRGADIYSYLAARKATEGRHYQLGTNHRSTAALVKAVNHLFLHAEGHGEHPGFAAGAFRFRRQGVNPLPFEAVDARGRAEQLVGVEGPYQALALCTPDSDALKADEYIAVFSHHCAEHIVRTLNDPHAGFDRAGEFTRLAPADIAVLVRNRKEARAIRDALHKRGVATVYLSDKDSVMQSGEAADVLRWLTAIASPLDSVLARAAFATTTAALPLATLAQLAADESAWEERVAQLKALHGVWQRQGVLAMLRRFIHELGLPAMLLREPGGERSLTNLLHLAELLQEASTQLDGEQALVRWFAAQVEGEGEGGDERVLRLESDAELVKVVTVHKSKGLEYPLVYLPFATSLRKADKRNRSFFEYVDGEGRRMLDLGLSDAALARVEQARLEEDLRLLYVALTRARHFLWLGVAAIAGRSSGSNSLHESALGYLLTGGAELNAAELHGRWVQACSGAEAIELQRLAPPAGMTMLSATRTETPLAPARSFSSDFERDWSVGSFTSLARLANSTPVRAQDETLLDDDVDDPARTAAQRTGDAPWHRFPRGSVPGNFLHEQLEWLAQEGFARFDEPFVQQQLQARIKRAGWENRLDDAIAWLRMVAGTRLPPLQASLADIGTTLPEMEFWFPSEHLDVGALDKLCRARLLDGTPRPRLPERELHGMLKGFADLVFESGGKFWVLDYKSNALGGNDSAYTRTAMLSGMAAHRYDIQGAIYMLALHRLLRARLGDAYDPAAQLGGAVFLFLRGIANAQTHGCCVLDPDIDFLDQLNGLLGAPR